MRHRFLPGAEMEFDEAEDYYEASQEGMGSQFRVAVRETVDAIAQRPTFNGQLIPGVYFQKTARFPYLVIYRIERDHVLIVAVSHERRDPKYWQDRLPQP
jgi:plasmid stabilization system protein ParE